MQTADQRRGQHGLSGTFFPSCRDTSALRASGFSDGRVRPGKTLQVFCFHTQRTLEAMVWEPGPGARDRRPLFQDGGLPKASPGFPALKESQERLGSLLNEEQLSSESDLVPVTTQQCPQSEPSW